MANEIYARIIFTWDFTVANRIVQKDFSLRTDDNGERWNRAVQNVGISWEAMEIGDLPKQWVIIRNMDATNFVSFGKSVADATELLRIPAGCFNFVYLTAAAPALKADTAICDVEIIGVEGSG
jgi:hypothetical protein